MQARVHTDPRRGARTRAAVAIVALIVLTSAAIAGLEAVQTRARHAVLAEYGEQQRLLARQTAQRLGDLAERVRLAAAPLRRLGPDADLDQLRETWRASYGTHGSELDLLQARDFEVRVTRVRPHEHHMHDRGDLEAVPCEVCIGEGATLPILVPLGPAIGQGPVVEVSIPLTELSRRLVSTERADAVWWADRVTGTLLASPSSRFLGEDLRSAAETCRAGLDALLAPQAARSGIARYCWPTNGRLAQRLAGFSSAPFLGLDSVVGVSIEEEAALGEVVQIQRLVRRLGAGAIVALLSAITWLLLAGRSQIMRERSGALASLTALSRALEARDRYTRFHSENVGTYAAELGRRLGMSDAVQTDLRMAGRMHDLGKIGICDGILNKPGALDDEERRTMEAHTTIGEGILRHLPWAEPLAEVAACHHEHMDGTGYPRRLVGADIPLYARVVAVADVLDALLTDRPYRDAIPLEGALSIIRGLSGSHLDPKAVAALLRDPVGLVQLGGGARPPALVAVPQAL